MRQIVTNASLENCNGVNDRSLLQFYPNWVVYIARLKSKLIYLILRIYSTRYITLVHTCAVHVRVQYMYVYH